MRNRNIWQPMWNVLCLFAVSLLICTSRAEAQRRDQGGMRPGNVSPARLLVIDEVQKELKLTESQKSKARPINERLTAGRQKLFASISRESGKRGPQVKKLNRAAESEIDELLDDAQEKRLREIWLQYNVAEGLDVEEVQQSLGLTEEQLTQIAEVKRNHAKAAKEALANFDGDRRAKQVELQKQLDAELLNVLTAEQRAKFYSMQGENVMIDLLAS